MTVLSVASNGSVSNVRDYISARREEVGKRLQIALESIVVTQWFEDFSEKELYEKGVGDASGVSQAVEKVKKAKTAADPTEIVAAVEDFIMFFCGFNSINAKYMVNAVHFQFAVDMDKLLSTVLPAPSADDAPSSAEKGLFDDAEIAMAELLLRVVVETDDGGLLANPFSPGKPMGSLLKLPLFAQLVMVLTNAVEANWYQQAIPDCPMAINLYASLLVDDAPVLLMVEGATVVEVMEMTKGAKRGPAVVEAVKKIRETGTTVFLDDFDSKHPGLDSSPDGIKVCVFANAFHSLQAFKENGAPAEMPVLDKEKTNDMDFKDFYCSLVPKMQPNITMIIMEGSENCLKSEVQGPPLNFGEPKATTASAHVYQAAAKALRPMNPDLKMYHQGGRALYEDEDFDEDACAVIASLKKTMSAAKTGDAGTMAWMGQEAVRRAEMRVRPLVCGVVKAAHPSSFGSAPVSPFTCRASSLVVHASSSGDVVHPSPIK